MYGRPPPGWSRSVICITLQTFLHREHVLTRRSHFNDIAVLAQSSIIFDATSKLVDCFVLKLSRKNQILDRRFVDCFVPDF